MAGVKLNHVYKRYGEITAVKDFHLEIADQEFIVLVGPSGCGKSTTLRMIAGLEEISEGELYIGDRLVNDVPPKDRDIAMVFQNYALYPHMTCYENMAFGLKLRKLDKSEIDRRVKEAAQILGIEHLLDRKPKALSGGQRQRVALGRAIVREPQVFLMDEPLSNLDAKLRVQMRTEISKLHQRLQTTFIYVTHDQVEAMTMGNRIVVMKDGIIQQADTPTEIYQRPANMFVAEFIGSPAINFVSGSLVEEEQKAYFVTTGVRLPLPDEHAAVLREKDYIGKEVVFGIRPESIHDDSLFLESSPDSTFLGKVEVVENMGSEMILYVSGFSDQWLTAKIHARTLLSPGDTIKLALDMKKAHIFDKESEMRVI
ncbi:ABC transporter ATP-binding protein [Thermoflavimicrobium dichotomicum]|uniref:Multiple sugar transport system ATP-binding protein n=1 Tax=Thermoflavimicrobium dichotomicum TaxID=46223 RepID=A0A1I3P064_9BACL|nr:ABC transporter ATP-binding protein [Thermoflavimicrobium dichotomicum]SFJ14945.1 multiple sugar transport system ATP-binding protein [Thermoflavimicrobium dichotomicum]